MNDWAGGMLRRSLSMGRLGSHPMLTLLESMPPTIVEG